MLVVLIALNSDTGKSGIASYIVWLSEISVSGGKTVFKEFYKVYLAAGCSQCKEIKIMYMYIAVHMRLGLFGREDVHFIELLGSLGAVFQHGTHSSVTVYIGIFTFHIAFYGRLKCKILINFHKSRIHLTDTCSVRAIEYIGLGGLSVSVLNQNFFYRILYLFNGGRIGIVKSGIFQHFTNFFRQILRGGIIASAYCRCRFVNCVGYLVQSELIRSSVSL